MFERMLDKSHQPTDAEIIGAIGQPLAGAWTALRTFLAETYGVVPIFNSGGKKYGWSLLHRAGGRSLCELYPEYGSFTVLVVLGKAELDQAMERLETMGPTIRQALLETPRLHDGCWMFLRICDAATCQKDVQDIEQLILIKKKPARKKTNTAIKR